MPPKIQIPREEILKAALNLLIREGNEAITISRIAAELGCSTQPVSHTFGSMEKFREEFLVYVLNYLSQRDMSGSQNPIELFGSVGVRYLSAAFEEPNLIRFVRMNSRKFVFHGGIGAVFDEKKNAELRKMLAAYLKISEEDAAGFIETSITYTQGLVSFIVDGTISITFDEALNRLHHIGKMYLVYAGLSVAEIEKKYKTV